jgi:hypothetical protein
MNNAAHDLMHSLAKFHVPVPNVSLAIIIKPKTEKKNMHSRPVVLNCINASAEERCMFLECLLPYTV